MNQLKGASIRVQVKLFHLLEEDFTKFKDEYKKIREKRDLLQKVI